MLLRTLKIVVVLTLIAFCSSPLVIWGYTSRARQEFQKAEASLQLGMSREEVRATEAWREFGRESWGYGEGKAESERIDLINIPKPFVSSQIAIFYDGKGRVRHISKDP